MSEGAIERLTQVIWELEAELGLLEWETHGVRLWEAARMPAYYAIAHQLGVLDTPTVMLPPGIAPRVRVAAELAAAGALKNPFVPAGKVDALVFESGRAYEVDGDWVCPYSFALTRELRAQGRKPLLLERRARGQKEKTSDPARRKLEALELARAVAGRVQAPRLARDPALRGMAERIDAALQLRYPGQRVTTLKTLSETLVRFQIDLALYRGLLALHRPREVYCVVAYAGFAPLMAAARERRIRSIELQHGVISHFHLGYSFPERDFATLRYFPDVVYTWGEPWDTLMDVPLPAERRQAYGFKYFEHRAQPYRHAEKSPRRLLVISQGTIGRELAEVVLRSAPALAHCEIKY
ncbi:MAG TPA: hypothetical protein VHM19_01665, partial [Polyangiales bacterium]|nr:hypothetical protein [Polyangiales bacterium]